MKNSVLFIVVVVVLTVGGCAMPQARYTMAQAYPQSQGGYCSGISTEECRTRIGVEREAVYLEQQKREIVYRDAFVREQLLQQQQWRSREANNSLTDFAGRIIGVIGLGKAVNRY
jgi:hypothetical protein